MEVFNAVVRLGGSLQNEVNKYGLTVPEILVLRKIHGDDGVVKIQHVGECFIDDDDERSRLHQIYGTGLEALHEDQKTSVEKMFGTYAPLPEELKGYEGPRVDVEKDDLEEFQEAPAYVSPSFKDKKEARKADLEKKRAAAKEKEARKELAKKNSKKGSNVEAVL